MSHAPIRRYCRARWPDPEVPPDSPVWTLYELDDVADAVTRLVEVFADGAMTRNSVELEQRKGDDCPSLFDTTLAEGFIGAKLENIDPETFEVHWAQGVDTPFWFPNGYAKPPRIIGAED